MTDLRARLTNRRERYRKQGCIGNIVDAHDTDVLRYARARRGERVHQSSSDLIVGADECVGGRGWRRQFQKIAAAELQNMSDVSERLPVAGYASRHRGGLA